MRMRVAPWSVLFAVWLVASTALGQGKGAAPTAPKTGSQAKAPAAAPAATPAAPAATDGASASTAPAEAPATAPGTETSATSTTAAPGNSEIDAGTYAVRLRDLEQRINDLKEQIFRSKARLSLLAETVLQGVVGGSRTTIVHENKMSGSFRLVKAVYSLDGAPILTRADEEGGLSERETFDVFNGSIVPGEHTLTVKLEYRGNGFGVFSYLKGYRFTVGPKSYAFTAPEGKALKLRVVGYEQGGPTTALDQRPTVRFIDTISEAKDEAPAAAGGAKKEAEGNK